MRPEVYLDHASTSYPKSGTIVDAVQSYLSEAGCSPGRSGYRRARRSEEIVDETRRLLGVLFNCEEYRNIAFTYNATYALNFAIKGLLQNGDHVVTTCTEHNSVLRPLESLRRRGVIEYTIAGLNKDSTLNLDDYRSAFRETTKAVIINHASNVTGVINPIEQMIPYAHEKGAKVIVDASQTAGFLDIDIDTLEVDFLVFTGHKSLLSLPGLGGLYVRDADGLETIIEGGTGGNSLSLVQPGFLPEKFEAGTCNYTGIAALGASVAELINGSLEAARQRERQLIAYIASRLGEIPDIVLYGDVDVAQKVAVLSFNVVGIPANEVSTILDDKFSVMTRPGLQCAPLIHKALNTSPGGTVRVSLGIHSTQAECDSLIDAVQDIIKERLTK